MGSVGVLDSNYARFTDFRERTEETGDSDGHGTGGISGSRNHTL